MSVSIKQFMFHNECIGKKFMLHNECIGKTIYVS